MVFDSLKYFIESIDEPLLLLRLQKIYSNMEIEGRGNPVYFTDMIPNEQELNRELSADCSFGIISVK